MGELATGSSFSPLTVSLLTETAAFSAQFLLKSGRLSIIFWVSHWAKYILIWPSGILGDLCLFSFKWMLCVHAQSLGSCLTLCDHMDCRPLGTSVHGILQARILKWAVIPLSRGIFLIQESNPCLLSFLHWQADSLPLGQLGSL